MAKLAKRVAKAREGIDRKKLYPVTDAVSMVKERASAKFDETVEVAINLARLTEGKLGYGQVKLANVVTLPPQWKELLDR